MNNMTDFSCKIDGCDRKFTNLTSLAVHLSRTHHMGHEEYYKTYIKTEDEGHCLYCGDPTDYDKWGYKNFCNRSCQFRHYEEQMLHTMEERYRAQYAAQCSELREKMENTCEERLEVKFGFHTEEAKNKAKEAAKNPSEETVRLRLEHSIKTCQEKYNVDYYFQSEEFKAKCQNTCQERYNVDCIFQLPEIQAKCHTPEVQAKRE